jgi:pimeloyl-ACP methyl ester carboxylesterase
MEATMNILAAITIMLIGLAVYGIVYQTIATRRDRQRFPAPGQMIDVGGYRLHLNLMGQNMSGPTVLLDAGMVSFSSNWAWVQPEVAKVTRVVAFDRAGLGWSDPGPKPRDAGHSAKELHAALRKAGIDGPFIMVGHSYGGLAMRAFTALYPDEVVGMVSVDGSHPDQWAIIGVSSRAPAMGNKVAGLLGLLGSWQLIDKEAETLAAGLPPRQYAEIKAFCMLPSALFSSSAAIGVWDDISRPLVNNAASLGDMALIVLDVTENRREVADKLAALQVKLTTLSTNSKHITVKGATHEGLVSRREYAASVTDAILQVVEAVRTGQPLEQIAVTQPV